MDALRSILAVTPLALLLGCPVQPPYTDDDAADDDDADDDGADDDGADDDGADDDSAPEDIDGYVTMSYYRSPDGMGGTLEGASLSASFYDVISEPSGTLQYEQPAGVDQCALTLYDYDDITGGDPGVYDYLSAGAITVAGPGGPFQLSYTNLGNGYWGYQMTLAPGSQLQFDAVYDVSAAGDEFPAFSAPGALEVPAPLQLSSPSQGGTFHVSGGDLTVAWSGGDPGTLWLYVSLASVSMEYGYISCEVTNDGSFAIPGALISQLPEGSGVLSLSQSAWTTVAAGGRHVSVAGMLTLSALGAKP